MWATKLQFGYSAGLFASLFGGLALLVSACGGSNMPSVGGPDPGPASCPTGIGGMPSGCCDSTGAAISPPPLSIAGCVNLSPGSAPIAGTGNNGAGSAGGSMNDIATAQGLVGGEVATGMSGQYAGATAGAQQPASALGNIGQLGANAATGAVNPTGSSGGSGSANAGSGTGSGMGLDNSSVSTAPAPGASGSPGVSGATAGAAAYGANGSAAAGGALPNGAHSTGFQFGNGFSGAGGTGGAAELAFANASGGGDAMLGGDPEDYFTRIGLEDSLFKKVERRYRDTSMHWASTEATSPSRSMASVPNVVPHGMAK